MDGARVFASPQVISSTPSEASHNPPSSALPWKPAIFQRVRASLRGQRAHVMEALVRLSGPDGRCWVSMATLADEARVDIKTARKHVHGLHLVGQYLRTDPMTWARLRAECRAAGRPEPRTNNHRTAPYLFTVLDGLGRPAYQLPEAERKHRLAPRLGRPPRLARADIRRPVSEPKTSGFDVGEGSQIWEARGLPNLGGEYSDPLDQSIKESVESPARARAEQHTSLVELSTGEKWQDGWRALLDAYGKHYRGTYGGAPMAPQKLRPDDPRDMGEHLVSKASELAARLDLLEQDALGKLADRTLAIWLDRKGSKGFLTLAAHPMWALRDELQARVQEAFKALLREHMQEMAPPKAEQIAVPSGPSAEELAANAKAAREALAFMQKLSRPEKPSPASPLVDAPPVELAGVSEDRPAVAQKQPEKVQTRPRQEVKPLPRRIEVLPPAVRPEMVRSAPRRGERRVWPVRVVSTSQTSEVELDETPPPE